MAPLLRRGLRCFYCGRRSSRKGTPGLQQWQCEACEAVNHLDEVCLHQQQSRISVVIRLTAWVQHGDITDPPALDDAPNIRYARTIERPVSPSFESPHESLFCNTCVKNQHVLTQALASYLPSPTDPQYPDYEKQYPEYRRGLEQRYPQVCDNCEPRVQDRLRATGYAAKTDHLRRMMDKTRVSKYKEYRGSWRHVVVRAGGLGWLLGLVGQMLWNALGSMAGFEGGPRDNIITVLLRRCIQYTRRAGWDAAELTNFAKTLATVSLFLAFLSIWWNPRLSSKIRGKPGRLIGLSEFYKLQGILNLTRLLAWYSVGKDLGFRLDSSTTKAVHTIMLVFNLVVSLISYRTVQIDSTPKVMFQDSPQSLHSRGPIESQDPSVTLSSTPSFPARTSINHHGSSVISQFPIQRLASPSPRIYTSSYQPPTPPPEIDVDQMDWTPAKTTFTPLSSVQQSGLNAVTVEPSPFHGLLPLPPMSEARRLRNPPNQNTFRKTSAVQQQRFLGGIMSSATAKNYDSDETETESHENLDMEHTTPVVNHIKIDRPRFFAQSDLEADTGLESLINGVFSLADDPPEIRAERERQTREQQLLQEDQNLRNSRAVRNRAAWERMSSIVLLSLACLSWSYAGTGALGAKILRYFALGTTAVILGRALFDAISIHQALWKASDILVLGVELGITVFLGRTVKSSVAEDEVNGYEYGSGPILFLGALWVQEFISFVRGFRASVSNATHSTVEPLFDASSSSDLDVSQPPQQDQNLASAAQYTGPYTGPDPSPSKTSLKAASTNPRPPRTRATRVEPSENLPGLSIGPKKTRSNASTLPRTPGWSNNQSIMSRSMRSSNGTPAWGRGNL
ncbi:hypothetical protein MMC11_001518 [Xylographa trunciseda]|nr:hypothetical protein [Xylographa trunciseda]